jgi:hypothetical protein
MSAVTLVCANCHAEFLGRPNRLHCSVGCRRQLEMLRREWDRKAQRVRYLELNARSEYLTKKQRANWQRQADDALARLGERP